MTMQVLVTGCYRTGSEYLTHLLNQHPDLSATMYHVNVMRFAYQQFDPIEYRWDEAVSAIRDRLQKRYQLELPAIPRGRTYGDLYDHAMTALWLSGTGKTHWAEKCQLLWRELPTFIEMMPQGKGILIIRDPRPVLDSWKRYTYAPPPLYLEAIFNCVDAMNYAEQYRKRKDIRVVRYEDLVGDPQGTLQALFEFLELDDFIVCPEAPINSTSQDGRERFNVIDALHNWRKRLSIEEIDLTEKVCGAQMVKWGYPLSGVTSLWERPQDLFLDNPRLESHIETWLTTGRGIEAFPQDPLDECNWEENQKQFHGGEGI